MAEKASLNGDENTAFNLRRYILTKDSWIDWIESIKSMLCPGKISGREICHEFIYSPFAPRGNRMEQYLQSLDSELTIDDSRFLASMALEDLADYISAVYDKNFSLIRYAESLATSEKDFTRFEKALENPVMKDFLEPLTEKVLSEMLPQDEEKILFCVSVPFAGCFASSLSICRKIRNLYGKKAVITIGGGYINTELRDTKEVHLSEYIDFISYDRGYGSYIDLFRNNFEKDRTYYKTAHYIVENKQITCVRPSEDEEAKKEFSLLENEFTKKVFPDFSGIDFSLYPRLADDTNPMHRIWSDGCWLKAYMAHGCYWHRCAFCDTSLDYVCSFIKLDCKKLHEHLYEQAEKTGIFGIHFVDEACPPMSLVEFGLENCLAKEKSGNPKLSFWGNIRFEKAFNRDYADFLAYSGLTGVSGGIEIATGSGLEKVNKGTDFESLVSACCSFKEAGILVHAYMIYGFYSESPQDTMNSMEVLRQMFENGLLDSSFWHKFVLTKHSTLFREYKQGLHPDLKPIIDKNEDSWFAQNDIHFQGEEKSEKFGPGLDLALDDWMHGQNLNRNVQTYFNFSVPKPSIPKNYVEKAIEKYEEEKNLRHKDMELFRERPESFYWLGGNVLQKSNTICWQYFGENIEANCQSEEKAENLIKILNTLKPENHKIKIIDIDLFSLKTYNKLRENGLVRLWR
ncbi:MAG: radical SAM protein [Treponemataceae bacterium]|nr:radical SAM protein [Treponemataceae bacterium]